jgi:uncharacterized membrane protein
MLGGELDEKRESMSQQNGKRRSTVQPRRSSPIESTPPPPVPADSPESTLSPGADEKSHQSAARARHKAQRAERIARLNEIPPDIPQLVVASVAALFVGILYLVLPDKLIVGPGWLLLVIEVLLLAPSFIALIFWGRRLPYRVARGLALLLSAIVTLALVVSVLLLIMHLTSKTLAGPDLLKSGAVLWASNVLVFAVWYWEMDGNGPHARVLARHQAQDFRFPQQEDGNPTGWAPGFVDYLFLAFCSATALSPADTMPLTQRAKLMTIAEAVLSMLIIVLLVARSVNILA